MKYEVILTGKVIPERAMLSVSESHYNILGTAIATAGEMTLEIILNQIIAIYRSDEKPTDVATLRNIVEDVTRTTLDGIGFLKGYGYDAEITQAIILPTNEKYIFGIDIPTLYMLPEKAGLSLKDIMSLATNISGHYIRRALADLREATKCPVDTGFFCYRAIEALKNDYAVRAQIANSPERKQWEAFRQHFGIDQNKVMKIKKIADPARHGNYNELTQISGNTRDDILRETWIMATAILLKLVTVQRSPSQV